MSCWLWYPGDFELYHAMRQNFSRVERGVGWPAFWKSEGIRNRIALRRSYELHAETDFTVYARGVGFVLVNEQKHPFGQKITCGPGTVHISIHLGRMEALPCALVEGTVISSDSSWTADDYAEVQPAGWNAHYTSPSQDPAIWEYSEKVFCPIRIEPVGKGFLYEWETELTASLQIEAADEQLRTMTVYCGESREEALAGKDCYLWWTPEISSPETSVPETMFSGSDSSTRIGRCPRCAVRFAYIPGPQVQVTAIHQYVDIPVRAEFFCDDDLLTRIWQVAEHTFRLCSDVFFLDGIKRDRWIWGGDAYQSLHVSRYLFADPGIEQRTLTALRGNDPMTGHINTIVDYSLLWVLSVLEHYKTSHDREWLRFIYPKVKSLLEFCESRVDEHGFIVGQNRDWTYLDWADLDKDGPCGGEQMLLYASFMAAAELASLLDEETDAAGYTDQASVLYEHIQSFYWSEESGGFVDSFTSGKCHISRQTNLLAIRCGAATERQTKIILKRVLQNDDIAPITTPYFQFYALDTLAQLGRLDEVLETIRSYWGGMLDRGAVTFWEEYDPAVTGSEQYAMYGDPFGKSLCHAWSSSPIYLIARYFVGLKLCDGDTNRFILTPQLEHFHQLHCTLPVGTDGGYVRVDWDGTNLKVDVRNTAGLIRFNGSEYELRSGSHFELNTDRPES